MNDWIASMGWSGIKPFLGSVLLPPLPLLLLVLVGALCLRRRPGLGWACLMAGLATLWAACTPALGLALVQGLTRPPPALGAAQRSALVAAPHTAIVVLGAGRRLSAPEYGQSDLAPMTAERLRYGLWLARQTRLPVAFSGGVGHGSLPGPSEAEIAAGVAARDAGLPLRWVESRSRDTAENARFTLDILAQDGVHSIVLVTHDFHQQRALAAFRREAARQGLQVNLVPAPLGLTPRRPGGSSGDWLPSAEGLAQTRWALHEWLGWIAGA